MATIIFMTGCAAKTNTTDSVQTVSPQGEYSKVNTSNSNEANKLLLNGSKKEKQKTIKEIQEHPDQYAPPVFYALSSVLFGEGKKDEAAFWFYAGQLRARYDANRCADISARSAVSALNQQFGTPINQYTFQDLPKLEKLIPRVIEWDKKTPHNYDHRWINLHGMSAINSALLGKSSSSSEEILSYPEAEWNSIAERTRNEYLKGFQEAMVQFKNMKK